MASNSKDGVSTSTCGSGPCSRLMMLCSLSIICMKCSERPDCLPEVVMDTLARRLLRTAATTLCCSCGTSSANLFQHSWQRASGSNAWHARAETSSPLTRPALGDGSSAELVLTQNRKQHCSHALLSVIPLKFPKPGLKNLSIVASCTAEE